jgi:hypothetical protein
MWSAPSVTRYGDNATLKGFHKNGVFLYNYFVTREEEKAIFLFPAIQSTAKKI